MVIINFTVLIIKFKLFFRDTKVIMDYKTPKIIVLCLHGCNQTPEAFKSYLNSFQKMAKKYNIELHFMRAPFEHPNGGLTWTNVPLHVEDIWHDCNSNNRENALTAVPGLKCNLDLLTESFNCLEDNIKKLQPNALLGFSQGAFVIYEYLRNRWSPNNQIKCLVAMSGYTFDNLNENELYDVPILNVVHPMDNVVPASLKFENSKNVKLLQHNNKNFKHPCREAHVLPTRNGDTREICKFIVENV